MTSKKDGCTSIRRDLSHGPERRPDVKWLFARPLPLRAEIAEQLGLSSHTGVRSDVLAVQYGRRSLCVILMNDVAAPSAMIPTGFLRVPVTPLLEMEGDASVTHWSRRPRIVSLDALAERAGPLSPPGQ